MALATINGILRSTDGTPWVNALWKCVAVSPSSPPVFADGTPVTAVGGRLDETGAFTGGIPRTDSIVPDGTTLTFTIYGVSSAPPSVIDAVTSTAPVIDLGAVLSPRLSTPSIPSGPLVYSYNPAWITNPQHGDGYIDTTLMQSFIFLGPNWVGLSLSVPGDLIVGGAFYCNSLAAYTADTPKTFSSYLTAIRCDDSNGSSYLSAPAQALFLNFDSGASGVYFGDGLGNRKGYIDASGNVIMNGYIFGGGFAAYAGPKQTFTEYKSQIRIDQGNGIAYFSGPAYVGLNFDSGQGVLFGNGAGTEVAHISSAGDANFNGNLNAQTIYGHGGFLAYSPSNFEGGTNFGNGSGVNVGSIDAAGNMHMAGNITAGTKSFKIQHPSDPSKDLNHSCLEGPEIAVFYRGEGVTVEGRAEIMLPDYFEALTLAERRTVQITAQVDDANPIFGGQLAAGRVANGKFMVYSTEASAIFYWEVKAVRKDVPELVVVADRTRPTQVDAPTIKGAPRRSPLLKTKVTVQ